MEAIEEFWLIFSEQSQQWIAVLSDGKSFSGNWGAVGYALGHVLDMLNRGEAEFECTENGYSFQHWIKDEEFWQN